jgi:hypothetical protein
MIVPAPPMLAMIAPASFTTSGKVISSPGPSEMSKLSLYLPGRSGQPGHRFGIVKHAEASGVLWV